MAGLQRKQSAIVTSLFKFLQIFYVLKFLATNHNNNY